MEILEFFVLIMGAILFTVSFLIPDKQVNAKEIKEKEERIFKELMEREMPDIRKKIEEATEDSIERVKENTQRQMERLTNEKMMAINEYSDTVMTEIHKNHEEAVFLYDMLNNKHTQVKNTAAELSQVVKQSKQVQSATKSTKAKEEKKVASSNTVKESKKKTSTEVKNVQVEDSFKPMETRELEVIIPPEVASQETKKETVTANNVEIMFATESKEENSNDRILELHKAGKSNMAIARELGLGIGEVKLVIDLFKGGM